MMRILSVCGVIAGCALVAAGCGAAPESSYGNGNGDPTDEKDSSVPSNNDKDSGVQTEEDSGTVTMPPAVDACAKGGCVDVSKLMGLTYGETALMMTEPTGLSQFFDPFVAQIIADGTQKAFMLNFYDGLDEAASDHAVGYGIGQLTADKSKYQFARTSSTIMRHTDGVTNGWTSDPFLMKLTMVVKLSGTTMTIPLKFKDTVYKMVVSSDQKQLENGTLDGWIAKADLAALDDPKIALGCATSAINCGTCPTASSVSNGAELVECHGAKTDTTRTTDYHVAFKVTEGQLTGTSFENL